MTFTLADDAALLQPITIGAHTAKNRLFMAPLTRSRAQSDGTPSDLQVEYYAQRASAGLIVTEATAISQVGNGAYVNTPGIYTDSHQEKWAEVASAVHAQDGLIFMQIWHVGRMAHPDISGAESVAPSPIAANMSAHTRTARSHCRCRVRSTPTKSPVWLCNSARPPAAPSTPDSTASKSILPTAICCTNSWPMPPTPAPTATADRRRTGPD
jgi:hypothetical protein